MKYIKELDSIRAIAVLAVMFSHYFSQFRLSGVFGSCGVTLFFVLSGYLITKILLNEKERFQIDIYQNLLKAPKVLKVFYLRRSLRIFPIYYLTFGLLLLLNIDSAREYILYHLFYASNFLYSYEISYDRLSHFWSLAVEEQFYLIWPFLILLIPLKANKIYIFISLIIGSILFKAWMISIHTRLGTAPFFLMPTCIDSFSLGAIAVLIEGKKISKRLLIILLLTSFLLFGLLQALPDVNSSRYSIFISELLSRSAFSLFSAILLLVVINKHFSGFLKWVIGNKYLQLLGKISYGVYIYHMFMPGLLQFLQGRFHFNLNGTGLYMPLNFIVTFCMAYFSFKLVESPINNLKKRFVYKSNLTAN